MGNLWLRARQEIMKRDRKLLRVIDSILFWKPIQIESGALSQMFYSHLLAYCYSTRAEQWTDRFMLIMFDFNNSSDFNNMPS